MADENLSLLTPDGKEVSTNCETLCATQLSTSGLVERRGKGEWAPSKFAVEWLKSDDASSLATHFQNHVKFFGELLDSIGVDTTHADLLEIAKSSYGLAWNSLDQVRRRTGWLRSLGMVELWGQKVVRTADGDALLTSLPLCLPEEALGGGEENMENVPKSVTDFLSQHTKIDQDELRRRRPLIGYIPRGTKGTARDDDASLTPIGAIRKIVGVLGTGMTVEDFRESCRSELGISKSSLESTLHTLRHMKIIEQSAFNFYSPTQEATRLTGQGMEVELVAFLHTRYAFFGEILNHLDTPTSTSSLTGLARESYGYTQASNGEIRLRLGFLQDAGLAERVDWQRFRITGSGKSIRSLLSMQTQGTESEISVQQSTQADKDLALTQVIEALGRHSRDGNESREFEIAVTEAFRILGFLTEHLGGPGNTDVLSRAELSPSDRYSVIIDTKSSGTGVVAESSVKFDALREHKRKHAADYVIVIGPSFANRLKNWAIENSVLLIEVAELVSILERHVINPLPLMEFREIFARVDAPKDELMERYDHLQRRSSLLRKILDLAFQEATDEDPIAAGYISVENMAYALRKEVAPRPSANEIRESLEFLSNPMIGALEEDKGRYKLADSTGNIALRLSGLSISLS
ncbi:hypothetical protein [Streptomyces sp. WM4235]|uniref:hypothetical protein n=1 Tax=Streptomyces sp. WM4235 TaxID=1415551 RepID=UPI00131C6A73|nr:hypothetical protein [Streptomyces sp. WM4235]